VFAVLRVLLFALVTVFALLLEGAIVIVAARLLHIPIDVTASSIIVLRAPQLIAVNALMAIALLCAMLVMGRIERRTLADYGFPVRGLFERPLWNGLVTGALGAAFVIAAMLLCGTAHVHASGAGAAAFAGSAALWAMAALLIGLNEELTFRGYTQSTLGRAFGFWPAAIVTSIFITLGHVLNPGETVVGVLSVFAFGIFFCYALRRFGDLRWLIGFHAAWDWTQTGLFGVPDSGLVATNAMFRTDLNGSGIFAGGSVGPEATIFTPLVLAVIAFVVLRPVTR
jgi:membrane protease YdiL (CAAX protease family)